jgi:hypothetical membrane protein
MKTPAVRLDNQRYPALAGITGSLVFALGVVLAGLTWEGYSHRTQTISDLGGTAAPLAIVQNVNFVVFGLLIVVLALGLRQSMRSGAGPGAGPLLLGYFGVMMIAQAVFPCAPGCEEGTFSDIAHVLTGLTGFLAFIVGVLLLSRRMKSEPGWSAHALYSALTGTAAFVALVAWLVTQNVDPDMLHAGAVQRVFIGIILVWLAVTGVRMLRLADDTAPGPAWSDDSLTL